MRLLSFVEVGFVTAASGLVCANDVYVQCWGWVGRPCVEAVRQGAESVIDHTPRLIWFPCQIGSRFYHSSGGVNLTEIVKPNGLP